MRLHKILPIFADVIEKQSFVRFMTTLRGPLRLCLYVALLVCGGSFGNARTELRVVATDPAGDDITLSPGQNYSLRIAYDTDEPVHIWAAPYLRGSPVNAMTNASEVYVGRGEALGWFALNGPGDVDEIRLSIDEKNSGRATLINNYPVRIKVAGAPGPPSMSDQAGWVSSLIDQSQERQSKQREVARNESRTMLHWIIAPALLLIMAVLLLAAIALPVRSFLKWEGVWRIIATVPLVIMAAKLGHIIIDITLDPTSHNLWPFELLICSLICLAIIGITMITRFVSNRQTSD